MTAVATEADARVQESVRRFVAYCETGATEGLFAPDVFADITLPHWRIHVQGAEALISAKNGMHPPGGRTRVEKVLAGPTGYTLKVEERWEDGGQQWYCREAFLVDLDDEGRVTELSVYCTGDWDEALVARHGEAVSLLRP
ncbi:hypothetical protein F0U44_17035 [Nocardioides humilatus]|uniref:Nuclear transport factor 2 family protein n=1 Tax=Nocardioides humilatus TaxID=2607660 RepID=A0A5B1L844_9ACTN|nr:hypothetical protein [Nocardioides humilatus]KAA1416891.1 hypothetical protein F0U44_17035 [Nocardioides humilatus]